MSIIICLSYLNSLLWSTCKCKTLSVDHRFFCLPYYEGWTHLPKKPDIGNLASGFRSSNKLNDNFDQIKASFDNTISRDGSGPNQMQAPLDLNGNRLLNVPSPATVGDPLRLGDIGFDFLSTPSIDLTIKTVTSKNVNAGQSLGAYYGDIGFGGSTWYSNNLFVLDYTQPHYSGVSPFAIVHKSKGSTRNGPSNAAYAGQVLSYKDNYLTSEVEGEIDGIFVCTRQGRLSDVAGILIDTQKVGDSDGGALSIEASTCRINNSGLKLNAVGSFVGHMESTTADGGDAGMRAEAHIGTIDAAFSATVFPKHLADAVPHPGGPGKFKYTYLSSPTRFSADRDFCVTGTANAAGGGVVQIGAGSSGIKNVYRSVQLVAFPSIAVNNTVSVPFYMSGPQVFDHVTVCAAGTDYASDKVIFTGRVTSPGTVTVYAHNMGSGAVVAAGSQTISVEVTRYSSVAVD